MSDGLHLHGLHYDRLDCIAITEITPRLLGAITWLESQLLILNHHYLDASQLRGLNRNYWMHRNYVA